MMINKGDNGLTHGRGYVYRLQYHIVWCVKYRRQVIKGDIESSFKRELRTTAEELGIKIDAMECMPDHSYQNPQREHGAEVVYPTPRTEEFFVGWTPVESVLLRIYRKR